MTPQNLTLINSLECSNLDNRTYWSLRTTLQWFHCKTLRRENSYWPFQLWKGMQCCQLPNPTFHRLCFQHHHQQFWQVYSSGRQVSRRPLPLSVCLCGYRLYRWFHYQIKSVRIYEDNPFRSFQHRPHCQNGGPLTHRAFGAYRRTHNSKIYDRLWFEWYFLFSRWICCTWR